MKKAIFGPGDCEETIVFADNLPSYVSAIARRYGHNVNPEEIETPYGNRVTSSSLEEGIAIPGVATNRRNIRRDILNEIGRMPIIFVPVEKQDVNPPFQRGIIEFC
jgi:hypothetical protein